jgi:hypothetical protein
MARLSVAQKRVMANLPVYGSEVKFDGTYQATVKSLARLGLVSYRRVTEMTRPERPGGLIWPGHDRTSTNYYVRRTGQTG